MGRKKKEIQEEEVEEGDYLEDTEDDAEEEEELKEELKDETEMRFEKMETKIAQLQKAIVINQKYITQHHKDLGIIDGKCIKLKDDFNILLEATK